MPCIEAIVDITGADDRVLEALESATAQPSGTVRVSIVGGRAQANAAQRWAAYRKRDLVHHLTVDEAVRADETDYVILLSGGELLSPEAGRIARPAMRGGADVVIGNEVAYYPDGSSPIGAHREADDQHCPGRALIFRRAFLRDVLDSLDAPPDIDGIVARALSSTESVARLSKPLIVRRRDGAGGDDDRTTAVLDALRTHSSGVRAVPIADVTARLSRWSRGAPSQNSISDVGSALRSLLDAGTVRMPTRLAAVCALLEDADLEGARVLLASERAPDRGPAARLRAATATLLCDSESLDVEKDIVALLGSAELLVPEDARAWNRLAEALARSRPEFTNAVVGLGNAEVRLRRRMTVRSVEAESRVLRISVAAGGAAAVPVLHDSHTGGLVRPRQDSVPDCESTRHVEFDIRALPIGHALTIAAIDATGTVTGVPFRGVVPRYEQRRPLLLDDYDGNLVVVRRRHWIVRAPRSVLRRLTGRGHR